MSGRVRRSREPFLWALFGGGGMAAALVLPALVGVLWLAAPLGWVEAPSWDGLRGVVLHPLTRLAVLGFATLAYFHWAHRFRYTLYDGLQLYHLNQLIAVLTYGIALALAAGTAWVMLGLG